MIDALGGFIRRALGLAKPFPLHPPPAGAPLEAQYDYHTAKVMERVLHPDSSCIDVGCHVGSILDVMLYFAPGGKHFAFEPLPDLFAGLERKYRGRAEVVLHNLALSDMSGETTFQHVVSNPGYSGIKRRRYSRDDEEVVEIRVKLARLDDVIPTDVPIQFVKIDVEGAELGVLKGAIELLRRNRPYVVFEHGIGGSDFYGTRPEQVHDLFSSVGLQVSTMDDWLSGRAALTRAAMAEQFDQATNFYFMAHPQAPRFQ